jgi:hypothetical protein
MRQILLRHVVSGAAIAVQLAFASPSYADTVQFQADLKGSAEVLWKPEEAIRRLIIPNGGNDRRTKLPCRLTVLAEGADGSPILAISG